MPIGTTMVQRNVNPKKLIFVGGFFAFILLNAATFVERRFWLFFILYALAFAVNQALTYMVPIHHAWLYFPQHGGLISGIILAGYGFGALIFDNVSTAIVNPGGKYTKDSNGWYPKEVNNKFETMMRVLIISWSACILIGMCLITRGPLPKKRSTTRPGYAHSPQLPGY